MVGAIGKSTSAVPQRTCTTDVREVSTTLIHSLSRANNRNRNLSVESHRRDAVENGFETMVVTDATGMGALEAAHTNYELVAHETAETDEVVDRLRWAAEETVAEE